MIVVVVDVGVGYVKSGDSGVGGVEGGIDAKGGVKKNGKAKFGWGWAWKYCWAWPGLFVVVKTIGCWANGGVPVGCAASNGWGNIAAGWNIGPPGWKPNAVGPNGIYWKLFI